MTFGRRSSTFAWVAMTFKINPCRGGLQQLLNIFSAYPGIILSPRACSSGVHPPLLQQTPSLQSAWYSTPSRAEPLRGELTCRSYGIWYVLMHKEEVTCCIGRLTCRASLLFLLVPITKYIHKLFYKRQY